MIVDDLDVLRIAFPELEADPPALVHRHRPLTFSSTFEFVQADTLQWTQILKCVRDVQRQQQLNGSVVIESTELVWVFTFPDFSAGRVAPGLDHGRNILRSTVNCERASVRRGYSRRNAATGSIREARHAGMPPAASPTEKSSAAATTVAGSLGERPNRKLATRREPARASPMPSEKPATRSAVRALPA